MLETQHRTRQPAGPRFGLLSVFALLAFACFPVVAGAADSGEVEYRDVPPGEISKERQNKNQATSGDPNRGSDQSGTQTGSNEGDAGGDGTQADESGGGGGGKGKDGDGKGGAGAEARKRRNGAGTQSNPIDPLPQSSDDGSSPLVPILIALAVLAAISIGAVAMRRKRRDSDPGSSVSPEAS